MMEVDVSSVVKRSNGSDVITDRTACYIYISCDGPLGKRLVLMAVEYFSRKKESFKTNLPYALQTRKAADQMGHVQLRGIQQEGG